jgi:hypothetical protein
MYWALTGKKIPTLFNIKQDDNSFILHDKIETPADLNREVPEPLSNLIMECVKAAPLKRPEGMNVVARRLETIQHAVARRAAEQSAALKSDKHLAV